MKKILLATAIIFMALISYAQSGDPLRDKLDSIFTFIDKSQIPTGYLKEYGSEMVPLHLRRGSCPHEPPFRAGKAIATVVFCVT